MHKIWEITCFVGVPLGIVSSVLCIRAEFIQWRKAHSGAGMLLSDFIKSPLTIFATVLVLASIAFAGTGIWLVYHPPIYAPSTSGTARATILPSVEPTAPVQESPAPVTPIPNSSGSTTPDKAARVTPIKPAPQLKAPLPAEKTPIPSVVIRGNVDQSGDGCQQKVIGGNNNTQNCVPPPRNVDAQKTRDSISSVPGVLFVLWEDGTPDGHRVAKQLLPALMSEWSLGTTITKTGDPDAFPFGVTLSVQPESSPEVKAVVESLKKSLNSQGIECGITPKEGAQANVVWVAVAGK